MPKRSVLGLGRASTSKARNASERGRKSGGEKSKRIF